MTANELYILDAQQKEMRAYDQKAGAYIASNAGTFVIALFTLCIFGFIHGEKPMEHGDPRWIALFALMIIYILLFAVANTFAILVLYPRSKPSKNDFHHIINFKDKDVFKDVDSAYATALARYDEIGKKQIIANANALRKKDTFSRPILWLSIGMDVALLVLTILLFVF